MGGRQHIAYDPLWMMTARTMRGVGVAIAVLTAAVTGAAAGAGAAARGQAAPSIWDGIYTDAQAARGQDRYKASCATCHAEDLLGASGPALVGESFMQRWNGTSVNDMLVVLRQTMPQDSPDSLGTPGYLDLIAFVLKNNSAPPGATELPGDAAALQRIRITSRAPVR
jgi:mono/diheme cytochrome c family protein